MHRFGLAFVLSGLLWSLGLGAAAAERPDCRRPMSLALHDHGLLYASATGRGIDRDIADELIRRSGCQINVSVMLRARIWQLIETGALDFSLSGISNPERDKFAAFAWYFANRYYLLVRKDTGATRLDEFERQPQLLMGAIRGFRYGPNANDFADRLHAAGRVSYATGLEPLYQVLAGNGIQGMIIEPFDYPALEERDIKAFTSILEFPDPPVRHGLIMSRKSVSPREQAQWQAVIDDMRRDGTVQRIFEKYFKPDLARAMATF